ncbi:putative small auxin-up RNA [Medicago truncatula]|uniref:Putative small auxin-up RNA n=1 Tax=Medicago truncatula TaxID=3880 RepID=G7L8D7_MEDTR|nr:auxin-responsive protein SAUR78 [Medicago truncatula]AET01858.1 SAUR-like auxin-responsive family protein [Medicago truncatula]RHN39526.1 putative small auxin-up RNA [Medicago truncatula]
MAKLGKLTKLKSAIKRWPSLTKLSRNNSSISSSSKQQEQELHAVYVGKSRRQYLVNSNVVQHPVFQELVDRSSCDDGVVVVSCEVVLFEHLLWMLESVEGETQLGSMAELVEFYNCGAC